MLSDKEIKELSSEVHSSHRPLIFFDDDQDGLCSFLLYYKTIGDGKGIPIKAAPRLNADFISKSSLEYPADKIFILDKAEVEQDFIDAFKSPVVWVDHHTPKKLKNVKYFNPRVSTPDQHKPTSYWCYVSSENPKLLWIATLGCVADWYIPEFIDEFKEKYPDLIDVDYKNPGDIIFESKFGKLIKAFSFILKGPTKKVLACMKILTRIKSPYEIMNQETPQGKFIWKRYLELNKDYELTLEEASSKADDTKLLLYHYQDNKMSFTADLSNELLHKYPDKLIIIAREKSGEMKCSLRSGSIPVAPLLKKALEGIDGYGGGHEFACGSCIQENDFDRFIDNVKVLLKKQ